MKQQEAEEERKHDRELAKSRHRMKKDAIQAERDAISGMKQSPFSPNRGNIPNI